MHRNRHIFNGSVRQESCVKIGKLEISVYSRGKDIDPMPKWLPIDVVIFMGI